MSGEQLNIQGDRRDFMQHAYNALFGGAMYGFPPEIKTKMVHEIASDLCLIVRSLPKPDQDEFLARVEHQVRTS